MWSSYTVGDSARKYIEPAGHLGLLKSTDFVIGLWEEKMVRRLYDQRRATRLVGVIRLALAHACEHKWRPAYGRIAGVCPECCLRDS